MKGRYFKDKGYEYAFYILELSGGTRLNKLGISYVPFPETKLLTLRRTVSEELEMSSLPPLLKSDVIEQLDRLIDMLKE